MTTDRKYLDRAGDLAMQIKTVVEIGLKEDPEFLGSNDYKERVFPMIAHYLEFQEMVNSFPEVNGQ